MKKMAFVIGILAGSLCAEHSRVEINKQRGTYVLDFDATYIVPIHQDYETAVTLPEGFTFMGLMPGSADYVSAGPLQNTIYISKPVDHAVQTNLTLHVKTPEGLMRRLFLDLNGRPGATRVLGIHFIKPNTSELDRAVEEVKNRYETQLAAKLSEQETTLKSSVRDVTLCKARPLFFNIHRGDLEKEFKGARVIFDGIITDGQDSYVYIRSNVKLDNCDVIKLRSVRFGKEYNSPATLMETSQLDTGETGYVYKIIALPVKKKTKLEFDVEIWSKKFTIKHKVS